MSREGEEVVLDRWSEMGRGVNFRGNVKGTNNNYASALTRALFQALGTR